MRLIHPRASARGSRLDHVLADLRCSPDRKLVMALGASNFETSSTRGCAVWRAGDFTKLYQNTLVDLIEPVCLGPSGAFYVLKPIAREIKRERASGIEYKGNRREWDIEGYRLLVNGERVVILRVVSIQCSVSSNCR